MCGTPKNEGPAVCETAGLRELSDRAIDNADNNEVARCFKISSFIAATMAGGAGTGLM